jgi:hypothetical protein
MCFDDANFNGLKSSRSMSLCQGAYDLRKSSTFARMLWLVSRHVNARREARLSFLSHAESQICFKAHRRRLAIAEAGLGELSTRNHGL